MADATVRVPGLLARFTDGERDVPIRADTVAEALERLLDTYPELESHLLDGSGGRRVHVNVFHEGCAVEWPDGPNVDLATGDTILVVQAISGE